MGIVSCFVVKKEFYPTITEIDVKSKIFTVVTAGADFRGVFLLSLPEFSIKRKAKIILKESLFIFYCFLYCGSFLFGVCFVLLLIFLLFFLRRFFSTVNLDWLFYEREVCLVDFFIFVYFLGAFFTMIAKKKPYAFSFVDIFIFKKLCPVKQL
jgi:hypothetical protein